MKRVFLWLIVFLMGGLLLAKPVQAEQCADWICWEYTCEPNTQGCPYGGWKQTCRCGEGEPCDQNPKPAGCTTCNPGEYVCNNECCPIDPGGGGGGGGGGGTDPYCGDNTCNNGETCQTCVGDCGACPVVSVDVKANGSDANIVTTRPYNISWDSVNSYENACLLNGSQVT